VTAPSPGGAPGAALVTGAAAGLGEGIARRLAADGWAVGLLDMNPAVVATAERLAAELGLPGGRMLPIVADVADAAAVDDAVAAVVEAFGGLELAVANAGIGGPSDEVVALDEADWDRVLAVNLRGAFLTCRAAARVMQAARAGSIVTVASLFGRDPVPRGAAYCASKAGVEALTRSLALELAPYGVRVNAVSPGNMATEMHWDELRARAAVSGRSFEAELEAARRDVPLGRHGTGADIGAAVAFLASDDAAYITGHTLSVNGGIQRT
jgi:NAD(P)-dependent dehydrogenase (short-subunit alcohol dehydrogenase family)